MLIVCHFDAFCNLKSNYYFFFPNRSLHQSIKCLKSCFDEFLRAFLNSFLKILGSKLTFSKIILAYSIGDILVVVFIKLINYETIYNLSQHKIRPQIVLIQQINLKKNHNSVRALICCQILYCDKL